MQSTAKEQIVLTYVSQLIILANCQQEVNETSSLENLKKLQAATATFNQLTQAIANLKGIIDVDENSINFSFWASRN